MISTLRTRLNTWPKLLLLALAASHPALARHLPSGKIACRYLDTSSPAAAPQRHELTEPPYDNRGTLIGTSLFTISRTKTATYIAAARPAGTSCVAEAGAGGTTCSGVPIGLGAAPVAGSTYSWSPATGLSSPTAANPTATLTNTTGAPITQTYILTETSATGSCQASNSVTVTVSPAVVAAAGGTTAICSGNTGQLGAAPVAGYSYSWNPATGLSSSTIANPTVTLTNATGTSVTTTYTLTATNTRTGCVGTGKVTVTVSPPPVAVPGAAVVICSGGTAQLGAAPAAAGLIYSWSPATGLSSSTVANPTVTLTNATGAPITTTYTLTTTNLSNCAAAATVPVTVNPLPVAATGAALTTCSGSAGQLGAAPVAGYSYSWSPATGLSSSTVANPTVTLANATGAPITQAYTLLVTNLATACASTGTVVVTVNPALGPGTIGADQAVCPGTSAAPLTSVAEASGGAGTYAYQWESAPDNAAPTWTAVAGATSATYAPGLVAAATYYRRRATSGCATATSNVVAVRLQPGLAVGVALATPAAQCAGLPFVFAPVPTNAGAAPTYRWFVNNILVATGATYTVATLRHGDQVRVALTPTVVSPCTSSPAEATVTISLTPAPLPTLAISAQTVLPACLQAPVTFQLDKVTDPGPNPLYQWQVDGVAVPGAQGPTFTSTTLRNGQAVTLALRTATACGPLTVVSDALPVSLTEGIDVAAGPNKTIMEGDRVVLEGAANGSYPVVWTPTASLSFDGTSRLRPIAAPTVTTTYMLSAGRGYCAASSSITVTVTPRLRIPNALSPNGDGQDDTWQIDHIGDYAGNKVVVLNCWGSRVFETAGYRRGNEWNGTIGGQPAPVGTYYYLITLGNGKSYTGPLTVVY